MTDSGFEYDRWGESLSVVLLDGSDVIGMGNQLRMFDKRLAEQCDLRLGLVTASGALHVSEVLARGEGRVSDMSVYSESDELGAPGEVWSSPGARGELGVGVEKCGDSGQGDWCVQLVLPLNFRFEDEDEKLVRSGEASKDFCEVLFGGPVADVRVIPGCVEVWTEDHTGCLRGCSDGAGGSTAVAAEWLGYFDRVFGADEKGWVGDRVEARRQLGFLDDDRVSGEVGAALCDAAIRSGNIEEAYVVELASGGHQGAYVSVLSIGRGSGDEVVLACGSTKGGVMATAVGLHFHGGRWPLHPETSLSKLLVAPKGRVPVVDSAMLKGGVVACTESVRNLLMGCGWPLVIPGGLGVTDVVSELQVLGEDPEHEEKIVCAIEVRNRSRSREIDQKYRSRSR